MVPMRRSRNDFKFVGIRDGVTIVLVKGGRRAYLWIGETKTDSHLATFAGPQALRMLAESILQEIPAKPRKRR
jgi:hypothetical protein